MSDFLYYCAKCNSLVADTYEEDDIPCESCGKKMTPLHIDEDEWNAMSNDEKMALLSKYRNPEPQVKKSRPAASSGRKKSISSSQQYNNSYSNEKDYYDKISGLSITGFILSFLGCLSIAGLVLGIVDLTKSREDGRKKGLSIAAIAISTVMLIATVAFTASALNGKSDKKSSSTPTATTTETGEASEAGRSEDVAEEQKEEVQTEFKAGETWTVDGEWSLTVLGATETEERNEYSEKKPGAVYIVDYMYTNLGYEDDFMDGLYFSLEDTIVDSAGTMGYSYPGDTVHSPQETPVGASCKAQSCIGVDNPGTFKITVTKYASKGGGKQTATFIIDPSAETIEADSASTQSVEVPALNTGETWTVDGQWELTITGATATEERNEYSEKTPEAVYIVDYTYKNTGYEDDVMDGLYFSLDDTIVDSEGAMGYSYPGDKEKSPQETPVGATCEAQACIGVDHAGDFKVTVTKYDGNGDKQSETFNVSVSQ